MEYFKHPQAIVETSDIGFGTRIWAFAHILPAAKIGSNCNICDHTFIENDVVIGDRVTIKCGVQIWDGIVIEDDVFIGPNATFTNDPYPRSKVHLNAYPCTRIQHGASIGANSTILPGITIGIFAMVGAGAVVTKNVPPYAIVKGNPAYITGYIGSNKTPLLQPELKRAQPDNFPVKGCHMLQAPVIKDMRGELSFGEIGKGLPFQPRRYFLVYNVPSKNVRGEHAHRSLHQLLICVKGSCSVMLDDGINRMELSLDCPDIALHIEPLVWASQYNFSSDAVLLVFASEVYDSGDYIRNYDDFIISVQSS